MALLGLQDATNEHVLRGTVLVDFRVCFPILERKQNVSFFISAIVSKIMHVFCLSNIQSDKEGVIIVL